MLPIYIINDLRNNLGFIIYCILFYVKLIFFVFVIGFDSEIDFGFDFIFI